MFISDAFAQTAETAGVSGSIAGTLIQIFGIFIVFYLLLIRPQQKKMKQHEAELLAIQKGDKIITGGGIYAKVIKIDGDDITVEISKDVEIKVHRYTIREVLHDEVSIQKKSKNNK